MDETKQIVDVLEKMLGDDSIWKYATPRTRSSQMYQWRLEIEPILDDIRHISRMRAAKDPDVPPDVLKKQFMHATREKYGRLFDWATRFETAEELNQVWRELRG